MRHRIIPIALALGVLALIAGPGRCGLPGMAVHKASLSPTSSGRRDTAPEPASLLRAAIEAGGCQEPDAIAHCQAIFDEFCNAQKGSLTIDQTDRQRAAHLLRAMHQQLLTGSFQPHCYRLDATLGGKSYNCLTSTILFLCLCREFDLPATAVAGPGHVYCRLQLDSPIDVQTTLASGLDGADGYEHEGSAPESPRGSTPSSDETGGELTEGVLEDSHLLARVYYNRGTSLLRQNEPSRALRYLQRAYQLDPENRGTRHNLVAAWNDWSLQLCDQRQFAASAEALHACLQFDPQNPVTLLNEVHIHHRWVTELCNGERFDDALKLLNECHARRPHEAFFDQGRWVVYRSWAASRLQNDGWEGAHDVFSQARQRHPDNAEQRESEVLFWSDQFEQLQQQGRHVEAMRLRQWLHALGTHLTSRDL